VTMVTLVAWAFPVIVVAYLIALITFIEMMAREHQDYWRSIGEPGLWDPNDQAAILKMIFLPGRLPDPLAIRHGLWLNTIRLFAALSVVLFVTVLSLIWNGKFDSA
jgi:hypothetical protein